MNAERRRAKILFWDGTGLCIFMKRLERARFAAPWTRASEGVIKMTASDLALFIEGSQLVFIGALSPEQVDPGRVITQPLTTR